MSQLSSRAGSLCARVSVGSPSGCHIYLISTLTSLPPLLPLLPPPPLLTVCASPRSPPLNCLEHLNTAPLRPFKLGGSVAHCDLRLIHLLAPHSPYLPRSIEWKRVGELDGGWLKPQDAFQRVGSVKTVVLKIKPFVLLFIAVGDPSLLKFTQIPCANNS